MREKNRQPVEPVEFPERSPVLAQPGFSNVFCVVSQRRSVPDGFGCTRAHQILRKEEENQRPVEKGLHSRNGKLRVHQIGNVDVVDSSVSCQSVGKR